MDGTSFAREYVFGPIVLEGMKSDPNIFYMYLGTLLFVVLIIGIFVWRAKSKKKCN